MQPLLKIQTIPIKIEAQTKRASFQESTKPVPAPPRRPAPVQQRIQPQQAESQPQPDIRVNQSRAVQRPAVADNASNYLREASNAVQAYNQSAVVGEVAAAEAPAASEYQAPVASPEPVQVSSPVPFDYSMDKETFDWNTNSKPQLEYIPASIEYSVAQYPDVIIEYVGEPIYVPASANPNYVPPPNVKGKA